jgi:hypothetical protein
MLLFLLLPGLRKRVAGRRRLTARRVLLLLLGLRPLALLLQEALPLVQPLHELLVTLRADLATHQGVVQERLLELHLLLQPEGRLCPAKGLKRMILRRKPRVGQTEARGHCSSVRFSVRKT